MWPKEFPASPLDRQMIPVSPPPPTPPERCVKRKTIREKSSMNRSDLAAFRACGEGGVVEWTLFGSESGRDLAPPPGVVNSWD
jgi:hypothetical protein